MNKKDFWKIMVCNIATVILLIEHLCGLDLALELMCCSAIISLIVFICIMRDYVKVYITTEDE